MKIFSYDSPFSQVLLKLAWSCYLNLLWFICSIPVFTVGASTTALYAVTLKIVRDKEGNLTGQFFRAFDFTRRGSASRGRRLYFISSFSDFPRRRRRVLDAGVSACDRGVRRLRDYFNLYIPVDGQRNQYKSRHAEKFFLNRYALSFLYDFNSRDSFRHVLYLCQHLHADFNFWGGIVRPAQFLFIIRRDSGVFRRSRERRERRRS